MNKENSNMKKRWAQKDLILVFNLYCRTPFGRMHKANQDIIQIASFLGRTPSSVAMKLGNFASFDPKLKARGIKGLANASKSDRDTWDAFHNNWELLAFESQQAIEKINNNLILNNREFPRGQTDRTSEVRTRLVQSFFRQSVLSAYECMCSICSISIPKLLIAGHVIPWHIDKSRRADPTNGICLCTLHDKAFDKGLISIDSNYRVRVSRILMEKSNSAMHRLAFHSVKGESLKLPARFAPDPIAIKYHLEQLYVGD